MAKRYRLDDPRFVKRMIQIFYGLCFILFVSDFFIHRHIERTWEGLPGFYALYGFIACVVLVILAKAMRKLVMRPADYYQQLKHQRHLNWQASRLENTQQNADKDTHG